MTGFIEGAGHQSILAMHKTVRAQSIDLAHTQGLDLKARAPCGLPSTWHHFEYRLEIQGPNTQQVWEAEVPAMEG